MSEMNYEALDEALDYIEAIEEGVNADLMSKSSSFRKEIRDFNKEYRSIMRNKEDGSRFNKARKLIDEFKDGPVKDYKEFVKSLDSSDTPSKIIGAMIGVLYTLSQSIIGLIAITFELVSINALEKAWQDSTMHQIFLGMNISSTIFKFAKDTNEDIEAFRDAYKDGGKEKNNYYITKCLGYAGAIEKQLEALKKAVDWKEAKAAEKNKF